MAGHSSTRESWRYWDFMSYENARKSEIGLNPCRFTMRFSKTYKFVQAHWCMLCLLGGIAFQITSRYHDLFPIAVFCYIGAAFFGIDLLYLLSYQCHVTPQKIVQIEFWIFKKEVAWSSITAKKQKRTRTSIQSSTQIDFLRSFCIVPIIKKHFDSLTKWLDLPFFKK